MATKEYKVRLAAKAPEATSAAVSVWLDEALAGDVKLAPDPGPGEDLVGVRLDPEKLVELANRKRERTHVTLRRLIATHVSLPPRAAREEREEKSAGAIAADLLPDKVLPAKQSYNAEKMLPFVRGMDKAMATAYRRIYGLKDLPTADTPEADRELAEAMAEVVNRRAPTWLIENADLAMLCVAAMRWGLCQTDELDREVKRRRRESSPGVIEIVAPKKHAEEKSKEDVPADGTSAALDSEIAAQAAAVDHMNLPVQLEGEF